MEVKNTGYLTVAEAAEKWDVTLRQVQRLLAAGRIPNAKKHGRTWLIPTEAEKPRDLRFEKKLTPREALAADIAYAIAFYDLSTPCDCPNMIPDSVPARFRVALEISIAYRRGDFERVKRLYLDIQGDDAVRLLAAEGALACAVHLGDYPFFLETENWLKALIKRNISETANIIAECALTISYLGAFAPDMAPDWLKNGDFPAVPPTVTPKLAYARTKYYQTTRQFEKMLATAQTALAFCDSQNKINSPVIYLSVLKAAACCALKRADEAERYLLDIMRTCLPHGFITPFAELASFFEGFVERCLEQGFPEYLDVIVKSWRDDIKNWISFHNQFTKDNVSLMLSLREYQIAVQVAKREPRYEIAKRFNLSPSGLNKVVETIYDKLLINNRTELAKYVIW